METSCFGVLCLVAVLVVVFLLCLALVDADFVLLLHAWFGVRPKSFFRGKVVWITGASSGIGEELAYLLCRCNAKLILSARRSEELERVKAKCLSATTFALNNGLDASHILIVCLDLTKLDSHEAAVDEVVSHFTKIDVLINNAGRSQREAEFCRISSIVDFDCFKVNTFGPVSLTRLVVSHMLQHGGGSVGVVSSIAGLIGVAKSSSYSAAKHALQGYFRCLDLEHRSENIRVTLACPGLVFAPNNIQNSYVERADQVYGQTYRKTWFHLTAERCAYLILVAIANDILECCMAHFLALLMLRMHHSVPALTRILFPFAAKHILPKLRGVADKKE